MQHEYTSKQIAAIAAKVLRTGKATKAELLALAASALTQTRDRAKAKKTSGRRSPSDRPNR